MSRWSCFPFSSSSGCTFIARKEVGAGSPEGYFHLKKCCRLQSKDNNPRGTRKSKEVTETQGAETCVTQEVGTRGAWIPAAGWPKANEFPQHVRLLSSKPQKLVTPPAKGPFLGQCTLTCPFPGGSSSLGQEGEELVMGGGTEEGLEVLGWGGRGRISNSSHPSAKWIRSLSPMHILLSCDTKQSSGTFSLWSPPLHLEASHLLGTHHSQSKCHSFLSSWPSLWPPQGSLRDLSSSPVIKMQVVGRAHIQFSLPGAGFPVNSWDTGLLEALLCVEGMAASGQEDRK